MANREKKSILVGQAISKLLDSQSVKVPENSALLNLFRPTTQKPPDYTDTHAKATVEAARQWEEWRRKSSPQTKRAAKKTKGVVLILIAWILLVLNVLVVIGSLEYGQNFSLRLRSIENTNGFLFQVGVLVFGAFVLACTTYLRNRAGGNAAVSLLIIMALSVTLASLVKESGGVMTIITNIRGLGRTLLGSLPDNKAVTKKPTFRLVNGILYSEDKPSAVIGSQIVREGDTLRYFNVVKIYRDKVEFEKDGKRWTQSIENRLLTY